MKNTQEPEWLEEYQQMLPPLLKEDDGEVNEWVRTRPAFIQEVIVRFPPGCVVELTDEKKRPFRYGIVSAYCDDGNHVRIRSQPLERQDHWIIFCWDHLTVIGYWNGFTPKWVKKVIEGV